MVGKEEYFFGGRDCSLALLPLIDNIMTTCHCSKILIGKLMTINLDDFVRPDSASSKAMNILLGPLFDVAGYAFAAAAVLAPFSGVNIVTRFEKTNGEEFFGNKHGELPRKDHIFSAGIIRDHVLSPTSMLNFPPLKKVLTQMIF